MSNQGVDGGNGLYHRAYIFLSQMEKSIYFSVLGWTHCKLSQWNMEWAELALSYWVRCSSRDAKEWQYCCTKWDSCSRCTSFRNQEIAAPGTRSRSLSQHAVGDKWSPSHGSHTYWQKKTLMRHCARVMTPRTSLSDVLWLTDVLTNRNSRFVQSRNQTRNITINYCRFPKRVEKSSSHEGHFCTHSNMKQTPYIVRLWVYIVAAPCARLAINTPWITQ